MRGIFVATEYSMASTPGGQQICTREYFEALQGAGVVLNVVNFKPANSFRHKLFRRLDRRPYRYFLPADLADLTIQRAFDTNATHIFLNTVNLAPLAAVLKQRAPELELVMLSHGLESVDYIHTLRTQNWRSDFAGLRPAQTLQLGQQLIEECRQRKHIDAVFCLAEFEAEIERWLGARRVLVVPRIVKPACIDWFPVFGRIGFVGRLDHPPNLEGLVEVLERLASFAGSYLDVRIVGAPGELGYKLANRFSFVTYLGVISDEDLLLEAGTWTCAMNPIFCFARGASTKLAVMAGWGIPLVTTRAGARGYEWHGGGPTICDFPDQFAATVSRIATDDTCWATEQQHAFHALKRAICLDDISTRISCFLGSSSVMSVGPIRGTFSHE